MTINSSTSVLGPDYVRAIAPYIGGKPISEVAREFGLDEAKIVKLASNENPLGVPVSAQIAVQTALTELGRYPDGNGFELKTALSKKLNIPIEWITLGNGSNDILELAARAIVQNGEAIMYAEHAFAVYALATQAIGARAIVVPAKEFGHDLQAMLAAITPDVRLIFIANPNNPTGTFVDGDALFAFLEQVPAHVVVVLDEAYTEYLSPARRYDSLAWIKRFPNLLVSRTFSKAYGLAGLRVGFGVAQPQLTDLLNRIRQPFNVNSLALVAAAAAVQDDEFLSQSAAINAQGYAQLTQAFTTLGLPFVPSSGNFVLVKVGEDDAAGGRINLALLRQGVIVRPVGNYGLPQWLRISIGLPEENAAFIQALIVALGKDRLADVLPGETFKDSLAQCAPITAFAALTLHDEQGIEAARILNQPGQQGSLSVYSHLAQRLGVCIDAVFAEKALALYGEHVEDAGQFPGKHPNIDRLLAIAGGAVPLTLRWVLAE